MSVVPSARPAGCARVATISTRLSAMRRPELVRVGRGRQRVVLAPHDQGRRGHPMQALVEPAVGDRPARTFPCSRAPTPAGECGGRRSGSSGIASMACAAGAVRVLNSSAGSSCGAGGDPVGDRQVVAPQPDRIEQHDLVEQVGVRGDSSAASIPPNDCPTDREAGQPQLAYDFLVDQHHVRQAVDLVDRVRITGAGAGELRRVDAVLSASCVEERIPEQAAGRV